MEILEVLKIEETDLDKRQIELCSICNGQGWFWSDLEFGDIPGDERKINCSHCNSTGRVTTLTMLVKSEVPFNFKIS